ncbi:phospholysine phosphohistidine inorganic pyrophosphate phosphatase isoform X2 [Paroedura picta]|uniref:phospholysine phosphohistidine inorganic pyrophosphate phosphatase isoform X2 n=1 Tax=Paroedura picta TaxID=143630 RepID=UPI004056DBBE
MCRSGRRLLKFAGGAGSAMADWARHLAGTKGLVLDISGVLYDSGGEGGGVPIPGSIEAVKKIKASGLKLQFCTNETQATREKFVEKLQHLGFDIVVNEVTAPAPAVCRILKERSLRPYLLVHDDVIPEFAGIDKTNPNCVVVGDAADNFSYKNLNEAFRVLIGLENPVLLSLGKGRYYKETDGLKLDVGVYMKALEAIMIGDDIVNDVGGAQQCGMRALQVRTGKYRCLSTFVSGVLRGMTTSRDVNLTCMFLFYEILCHQIDARAAHTGGQFVQVINRSCGISNIVLHNILSNDFSAVFLLVIHPSIDLDGPCESKSALDCSHNVKFLDSKGLDISQERAREPTSYPDLLDCSPICTATSSPTGTTSASVTCFQVYQAGKENAKFGNRNCN